MEIVLHWRASAVPAPAEDNENKHPPTAQEA